MRYGGSTTVGPCLPDFQPPDDRSGARRVRLLVIFVVLGFDALLILLGLDVRAALAGAAAGGLVAGEVAHRVLLGDSGERLAMVIFVLGVLMFAVLLMEVRGLDPGVALAEAGAAGVVAGEVAHHIVGPLSRSRLRWDS